MQAPVQSCTRSISPFAVLLKECVKSTAVLVTCSDFFRSNQPILLQVPKERKLLKEKFQNGKGKAVRVPYEEKN
jgi:hypothetical protein